jgi:hypothetical protein
MMPPEQVSHACIARRRARMCGAERSDAGAFRASGEIGEC